MAPLWIVLEQIWGWKVPEALMCDNAAAVAAIKAGVSKKLSYVRRTQRVSLGFWADYVVSPGTSITQVETSLQRGDMFTKSLEQQLHERNSRALGIE